MKYAIVDQYAGNVSTRRACELLDVRRQGYYEWRLRRKTPRQVYDELLTEKIKNIFFESKRIYGARKILSLLRREKHFVSRGRVRRLMAAAGLVPVTFRRFVHTTDSKHSMAVCPNLLSGDLKVEEPDRVWVSDMTYIRTDEGWLYLCSVLDIYSRRVVGWAVSQTIDRHLAIAALKNATESRKPAPGLIFHTDRGCQYASSDFRNAVAQMGGIGSMSRSGNPYDNAYAESFFRSIKVEWLDTQHSKTRTQAAQAVSEYMLFYNRKRIHASLGYLSPLEFESGLAGAPIAS